MAKIQFYAVNDQRSTAPKKGYSLRPVHATRIDGRELSKHVEMDSGIDHARVEYIMAAVVKQIREMVLNGHQVELGELGTIGLTCHGKCSDTEEGLSVRNNVERLQIKFRPSVSLRSKLQAVSCELTVPGSYDQRKRDEHGAILIEDGKKE